MNKTLSGCLQELKNKGKVQLGNLKSGRSGLQELFITKCKSVQMGFHKGGRNQSWLLARSSGHKESFDCIIFLQSLVTNYSVANTKLKKQITKFRMKCL